ncbi:MAG: sulfatase-like hydrolase/transferase [Flammeovirgaceae bacterium]
MKNKLALFICLLSLTIIISCNDDQATPDTSSTSPNILLIIADDMGLDATPGYTIGATKPTMPHLESLMADGLRFNNTWSSSVCTPTRATILTGKYGVNSGVLAVGDLLNTSEQSIHRYLDQQTNQRYRHAVIGKWHLAGNGSANITHPADMGVDFYAGLISGAVTDYSSWPLTENGQTTTSNTYITTKITDLAIDWLGNQDQPWFLWVAYTAPHTPFHLPPSHLHSQGNLPTDQASITSNPEPYFMAMMEAMDTEIGRLLAAIPTEELENTTIIFVGDNGTTGAVIQNPYSRRTAKGTLYQGGVNVPMIVSGYGVTRTGSEAALIHTSDLFATIADLAGTATSSIQNSFSFMPLLSNANAAQRDFVYTDDANGWAIRNAPYKLIEFNNGSQEMYHLTTDPYERTNLLDAPLTSEATAAKTALESEAAAIR